MAEEAIFSFVLESLRDIVMWEARFLFGVKGQVKSLERELRHMSWFLRDSDAANQDAQKRVLDWVNQVRDNAYQAENLIETYVFKVASRRGGGIKRVAGFYKECYHLHRVGSDIERLLSNISDLNTSISTYGIREIMEKRVDGASSLSLLRRTYSTRNDELFFGSDDSNMLAQMLVNNQYSTVCLHGMGGLGKTTLAKKVYHHPEVKSHFDGFAWVCISQQWDTDVILKGILTKFMPHERDDIAKLINQELVSKLFQYLSTKKCLLVLDDIWTIHAWATIKSAIPIKENGSKVLITTRNSEVGTQIDTHGFKYQPKFLTADESWKLLCNKALRGQQGVDLDSSSTGALNVEESNEVVGDSRERIDMERIGKEMIKHCDGLPLAVVALGGILSTKHSYNAWKRVHDDIKSSLSRDNTKNLNAVLALSYDDLPFELKPCFLYLSRYAEDAKIEAETLYQYWMAEGMVTSKDRKGNETLMDVAEHYLNELAERSMVFVQKAKEYSFTRFKSCRLHDLMRDICISKAKEEKFLQSIDYGNIHAVDEGRETSTICRLSFSFFGEKNDKIFVPPSKALRRSLRSFTLNSARKNTSKLNFSEFFILRVLSLNDVGIEDDVAQHKDPLSIGKLVHLRYLSLRNNDFRIMSSPISKLKLLQTLDLRGCKHFWWISEVWNLPRLNHLYLPRKIKLGDSAKKLGFDGMPQLEILTGFNNKVCNVKHLWTLTNLRVLEARVTYNLEDLEELINHVRKLTHLRDLQLRIKIADLSSEKGEAIMNDILSCSNLVTLYIWGKLSKFPEYDTDLCQNLRCQNLRSLTLFQCEIEEDPFRTLERLPNLRKLDISDSYVGKEMSCHASGFPQLRFLYLDTLRNLEKWEIEDGAMPNLTKLSISQCEKLSMIPAGLRSNTLLKYLTIISMPEEFKKRVVVNEEGEEGPDFHKLRHVQTIHIH